MTLKKPWQAIGLPLPPIATGLGISCDAKHLWVTTLNLSHMGLTETIAPQAGNLSFLPHLSLKNNNFHGSLPNKLAYLGQLEVVCFGLNSFFGVLPSWLESLPKIPNDLFYSRELGILIPNFSSRAVLLTFFLNFFLIFLSLRLYWMLVWLVVKLSINFCFCR